MEEDPRRFKPSHKSRIPVVYKKQKCHLCGNSEGRMLRVTNRIFECNRCSNQSINETVSGSGGVAHFSSDFQDGSQFKH